MSCRTQRRGRVLALALMITACVVWPSAMADVWGYVDAQGVAHFSDTRLDDRYQLFFRGDFAAPPPAQPAPEPPFADEALKQTRVFKRVVNHPNVARFATLIEQEAQAQGLDPALVKAVIAVESSFEPAAVSPKGALGLMQVIPDTASRYGVVTDRKRSAEQKLLEPGTNVRIGTRYLRYLLALFDGDRTLALAGYNAGEDAVLRYGRRIPPYAETRDYVKLVERFYAFYRPVVRAASEPTGSRVRGFLLPQRIPRALPVVAVQAPTAPVEQISD